jgi:hypothetical protein
MDAPFWKARPLAELSAEEWESLCDGCAKCCLIKLEDEDTAEVVYTGLHCRMLDAGTCRCSDYPNRRAHVPDCVQLTPDNLSTLDWMPRTCAYRLVAAGKDLPDWHHLVCGDRWEVHRRGVSAMGKTVSEEEVEEDEVVLHIRDWDKETRRRRRR